MTDEALSGVILVGGNVVFIQRKVVASVEGFGFTRIVTTLKRVLIDKHQ